MRIGVNGYVGSHRTGIGRYLDNLITGWRPLLASGKHELVLFANPDSPLKSVRTDWIELRTISASANSSVRNLAWSVGKARNEMRTAKLDLLFQPNFTWTPRLDVPIVSTIHDVIEFKVRAKFSLVRTVYRHRAVPRMAQLSRLILTVSETSRRDIVETFGVSPSRVIAIPNGVSRRFSPAQRHAFSEKVAPLGVRQPYVLFVGTLDHPGKNAAALIRAFAQASGRLPQGTQLVLAGKPGKGFEELASLATELNLGPQSETARWIGYVSDDVLPALYAAASAFVFPSLYEGFGLPVIEAMASGVPVVTSNNGALAEVAGEAAILVPPTDVHRIGEQLLSLFENGAAGRLVEAGLRRAASFSWDVTAAESLRHILSVVD